MTILDSAGFAAHAHEQVLDADAILAGHDMQGPMCSCGRPLPCPQALSVRRRRAYFAAHLAHLRPAVGRATVPGVISVEIVATRDESGDTS
ncbi:MAG: hypothetical protein ACRDT6_11575 [Micromonosporaceae bacterium]